MESAAQKQAIVAFASAGVLTLALGLYAAVELRVPGGAVADAAHNASHGGAVAVVVALAALIVGCIAIGVVLIARGASAAGQLGEAARAIAVGEFDERWAEAGDLSGGGEEGGDDLSGMLDYLRRTADVAHKIATGTLDRPVVPLSEQDSLGCSLSSIAERIETLEMDNRRLEVANAKRADLDPLTSLPSRSALMRDLEVYLSQAEVPNLMLALFDLDGFKPYNDAFSYPAGDALLIRLAGRLNRSLDGSSRCYRMGGDEFCVLASTDERRGIALAKRAADTLSEQGDAFSIGCSFGVAFIPLEATTASDALRVADKRMYEQKMANAAHSRESTNVLLKVLSERSPGLIERTSEVADLAAETAESLGVAESEVKRIELAAKLRDIGMFAIPDPILNKPGPLDDVEWEFVRRHTAIGARIIAAAPSLSGAAELVRAHHEWFDGSGYPEGAAGDAIPLGASIISVCDAYGAMIEDRPYRSRLTSKEAIEELNRRSGTQFSPEVVRAFTLLVVRQRHDERVIA